METTISVYISDLSRFEYDGLIVGKWFTLPVSESDVFNQLEMNADDSYEIEDWESPFRFYGRESLDELNQLAILIENAGNNQALFYLDELVEKGMISTIPEGLEKLTEGKIQHFSETPLNNFLGIVYQMADGSFIGIKR
ncbi:MULTISPECIES: antirestriction protein ArdA [unclassified Enterococcus]|uniref:antirestriction protein ArdA n=1 Tax=unclassified Enterococcus TaxID=2608891 RepID=UPI001907CD1B|nr:MULTISPECIES: antirestriction protein ArdA [unclassified Enterococcus]MBK0036041.1 antirestriction protein ArdA [Enterococcus sp. S52]MBK0068699.1 antirestriction protein ArdA [Enterococcus sp. S53]MBK0139292.1 antirestriction protein ArdA [Enterococcus sp. S76]MBK0142927.1 antirestriction protein ArdA [Enterococcus sp. S77]